MTTDGLLIVTILAPGGRKVSRQAISVVLPALPGPAAVRKDAPFAIEWSEYAAISTFSVLAAIKKKIADMRTDPTKGSDMAEGA